MLEYITRNSKRTASNQKSDIIRDPMLKTSVSVEDLKEGDKVPLTYGNYGLYEEGARWEDEDVIWDLDSNKYVPIEMIDWDAIHADPSKIIKAKGLQFKLSSRQAQVDTKEAPFKVKRLRDKSIPQKSVLEDIAPEIVKEPDLDVAKDLMVTKIQDSKINDTSKKKMLYDIENITYKEKLVQYLYNAILALDPGLKTLKFKTTAKKKINIRPGKREGQYSNDNFWKVSNIRKETRLSNYLVEADDEIRSIASKDISEEEKVDEIRTRIGALLEEGEYNDVSNIPGYATTNTESVNIEDGDIVDLIEEMKSYD